jgi:hypothetical protein
MIGAVWGVVLSLIALFLPGSNAFVAGGVLAIGVSMLIGGLSGAVVGVLAAALLRFGGIPQAEAQTYEPLLHRDNTLVAVKIRDEDAPDVRRTLNKAGATSVQGDEASAILAVQKNG